MSARPSASAKRVSMLAASRVASLAVRALIPRLPHATLHDLGPAKAEGLAPAHVALTSTGVMLLGAMHVSTMAGSSLVKHSYLSLHHKHKHNSTSKDSAAVF